MGGFQLIQILGLMGMYFDALLVEVKTFLLLFRLALAILCIVTLNLYIKNYNAKLFFIHFNHYDVIISIHIKLPTCLTLVSKFHRPSSLEGLSSKPSKAD